MFCGEKFCFELYIDIREEWIFLPKTRYGSQSVPVFFSSQAGIQRSFLDVQSLTGLYTDICSGRIGHPKTRYGPGTALFFSSQAGIQRLFLDVQSLTGLYTDIRSGRIVHPQTRYGPGTAPLFFRAKRGIRGCFVGEISVPNCI